MELPEIVTIKKVVKENRKARTFFFDMSKITKGASSGSSDQRKPAIFEHELRNSQSEFLVCWKALLSNTQEPLVLDKKIKPLAGQFVMVWLPGIDEKPFALSYDNAVTVERKGVFTKKMFELKKGDRIGVRGPYGNGFKLKNNALVVAGGLGIASLARLVERLKNPEIILGAKTKEELLFAKRFRKKKLHIATDDGSIGFKGFATELMQEILKKKRFRAVYTCGPEIMMKKIFELCEKKKIECYASLERYIKCGFGVCGACACGDQLVCKDGPVFNSKQLRKMEDFGSYSRPKDGKKVSLAYYAKWRSR